MDRGDWEAALADGGHLDFMGDASSLLLRQSPSAKAPPLVPSPLSPLPSLSLDDLLPSGLPSPSVSPGLAAILPGDVNLFPTPPVATLPPPASPVVVAPQCIDLRIVKENGVLGFGVVPRRGMGGVQVSTLQPASSADRAGLRIDDCLLRIGVNDVGSMALNDVVEQLKAVRPGEAIMLRVYRPTAPPTKKPRLMAPETALKKQISERNTALRKRVQEVVIKADETVLRVTKEKDAVIARLTQEKADAAQALAALQAQMRIEARTLFDANANAEIKAQLDAAVLKVADLEDAERKRLAAKKHYLSVQGALAGKLVAELETRVVEQLQIALAGMAAARAATKSNAFHAATLPPTLTIAVELCRPAAVLQLLDVTSVYDVFGFPVLTPLRLTWPAARAHAVFGQRLVYEERTGVHLVASGPVETKFDPTTELLEMTWKWSEHSVLREIGRSIRLA
ncbi:hypothetical protein SPRG_06540 [Saprolegnia parasitica CBS 223.65]|uniref:PDZ domain-containing protein n=1 Tax=Saprolegnia parasitica (strain CBS 223.65) TaxID=695850 RepID=A0A067CQB3_SAPPC|nr:hypothetical protein SPRG_06540 [Saprolegnia parasitica CBS 223.65]KDO28686.1 hypothetical protein SPRG_06540 [Saprolegnia parasitica CBS 223.65]|eukprot:XP_012200744.1 hypothetical protein SPRG_06540 [Saprolegnia parasitica CBS 223.65]